MKPHLVLFVVALAVRLVPWAAGLGDRAHVMQSPDCFGYDQAAVNLLDHGTLSLAKAPPVTPDTFRTPGYPLFIAAVYAVAGRAPHAAVGLQILLAALSCLLLARWSTPLVGARAAWLAGLAWALDVGAAANSTILLSETLCLLFLMASHVALEPAFGAALPDRRALAAGALLACSALVRPTVLYWVPLTAIALAVALGRRGLRPIALLALAFVLPCALWVARNAAQTGVAEFSSVEGEVLLFYRASGAMARVWNVPVAEAWKRLADEADRELARRGWPAARHGQLCKELAIHYLLAHPREHVPVVIAGALRAWVGLSIYDLLKHFDLDPHGLGLFEKGLSGVPGRLAALSGVELAAVVFDVTLRLAVIALGVAGLALLLRRRAWTALAVILPPLAYVTLTAGTVVSYYRFRLPLVPFWSIAVGVALEAALARVRPAASGGGALAGDDHHRLSE